MERESWRPRDKEGKQKERRRKPSKREGKKERQKGRKNEGSDKPQQLTEAQMTSDLSQAVRGLLLATQPTATVSGGVWRGEETRKRKANIMFWEGESRV